MTKEIKWENLPNGIFGWILWSLPKKSWRPVVWAIGIFSAITAMVAFNQLRTIRSSEIDNIRSKIFKEEWDRNDRPEWKIELLNVWSEPWEIPDTIWNEAIHGDIKVRKTVAKLSNTPSFFRNELLEDEDFGVRILAIFHESNKPHVQSRLARETSDNIMRILASNKFTPEETLSALVKDGDETIRRYVAANPNTSEEILERLSNDSVSWVRLNVAENSNTPDSTLHRMAEVSLGGSRTDDAADAVSVLCAIAINLNTDKETLIKLADDDNPEVNRNLATNPGTPLFILDRLAEMHDPSIRASLAANPATLPRILEKLVVEAKQEIDSVVLMNVASNRNTSATTLQSLVERGSIQVDEMLADNPALPPGMLAALAERSGPYIQERIAGNPACPFHILKGLSSESNPVNVVASVAGNPKTPKELLESLATRLDKDIRAAIAGNPGVPEHILREMYDGYNNSEEILMALASNPTTPNDILSELSIHQFRSVRIAVARNKETPMHIIESIGHNENDTEIREIIADHPKVSEAYLMSMLEDKKEQLVFKAIEILLNRNEGFINH